MEKLDLTKHYRAYYSAKTKPELVQIEEAQFISLPGKGDPSAEEFAARISVLYTVAYNLKFKYKAINRDFVVAKLEGLWWFNEKKYSGITMADAPQKIPRREWEYRLLIRVPDYITPELITASIQETAAKKQMNQVNEVELYHMAEGKVVQMLHIGSFEQEPETLTIMNQFIQANELQRNGIHHEIYLSDFRKTAPDRLKTILREPVE